MLKSDKFGRERLLEALKLLSERLRLNKSGQYALLVCGGSALIALNYKDRVTKDVDIVALVLGDLILSDPDPLPEELTKAAEEVSTDMALPSDWLNNGPSRGEGGLFRMGLPEGIEKRAKRQSFGENLTVFWIDRIDQIYFKLYASIDRGGYHVDDLLELKPTADEILSASQWCMTHDVSEGFRQILILFLGKFGYGSIISRF
ncbi:MAG: hypothetical protein ACOX2F_04190 [bacterium]